MELVCHMVRRYDSQVKRFPATRTITPMQSLCNQHLISNVEGLIRST
jgi:hypothetical protein